MIAYLCRRLLYITRMERLGGFPFCFNAWVQQYKLSISPTEYRFCDEYLILLLNLSTEMGEVFSSALGKTIAGKV